VVVGGMDNWGGKESDIYQWGRGTVSVIFEGGLVSTRRGNSSLYEKNTGQGIRRGRRPSEVSAGGGRGLMAIWQTFKRTFLRRGRRQHAIEE